MTIHRPFFPDPGSIPRNNSSLMSLVACTQPNWFRSNTPPSSLFPTIRRIVSPLSLSLLLLRLGFPPCVVHHARYFLFRVSVRARLVALFDINIAWSSQIIPLEHFQLPFPSLSLRSRDFSLSLWPSFISLVGGARRIIGRDAVGRNAGAFVYGTRANATLILLSSYSSRAVPSLSISLQAVWDAQIKGDSVRAESPFRMERLSALPASSSSSPSSSSLSSSFASRRVYPLYIYLDWPTTGKRGAQRS